LFPQWAFAVTFLLIVFKIYDYVFSREDVETPGALTGGCSISRASRHIEGAENFLYLGGIIADRRRGRALRLAAGSAENDDDFHGSAFRLTGSWRVFLDDAPTYPAFLSIAS
jgi:hypothetical protein